MDSDSGTEDTTRPTKRVRGTKGASRVTKAGHLISGSPELQGTIAVLLSSDPGTTNRAKETYDATGLNALVENFASALSSFSVGVRDEKPRQGTAVDRTAVPYRSVDATGMPFSTVDSSPLLLFPHVPSGQSDTSASWQSRNTTSGFEDPGSSGQDPGSGGPDGPSTIVGSSAVAASPMHANDSSRSGTTLVALPPDHIRIQVLDLYFNQVVNTSLPMLDKNLFLRWSAQLPSSAVTDLTKLASDVSVELALALFAVTVPYLPPAVAAELSDARAFAAAARWHLHLAMQAPTLQTVQAACLLAITDWAHGQLHRAWTLSALSLALALSLSLHRVDTKHGQGKGTLDAVASVHALLSLRVALPSLAPWDSIPEPSPSMDSDEDFELWRSDKAPAALRGERGLQPGLSSIPSRTVRSGALSTFARLTALCKTASSVEQWEQRPPDDSKEADRQNLLLALVTWQRALPEYLCLGPTASSISQLQNRSRHIVDMHLVFLALWIKLIRPSPKPEDQQSLAAVVDVLTQCLNAYREHFTLLRSLPWVEMVLDVLRAATSADSAVVQDAYAELACVLPVAANYAPVGVAAQHDSSSGSDPAFPISEMALEPTSAQLQHPQAAQSASSKPFEALLSFSNELGNGANPTTVVDYSTWDQADLLVSLGLIADPNSTTAVPGTWAGHGFSNETGIEPVPPLPDANESDPSNSIHARPSTLGSPMPDVNSASGSMTPWPELQQPPMDLMDRWMARGALGF
ncbi:hypothetical protein OIV83_005148 [Microbotryomycetes sp. JL201]|nr:hypothetical protein OIV83_005148 [Microbotryomycetes sp. JL201]